MCIKRYIGSFERVNSIGVPTIGYIILQFGEKQIRLASVTINEQQNETATMRRFCDRAGKPNWILTEKETVDITFFSKVEPENHFWLSWTNEGMFVLYI